MRRPSLMALGAAVLVALVYVAPASASAAGAKNFIRTMGIKAFASLSEEGISEEERTKRFRELLQEAFDLPRIARFTLGRYWRVASDEEKKEYVGLFEKFVIQAYATRFRDLSGKKLNVLQSRDITATQALVLSEITIPNQPAVKINWRVRTKDDMHKITDVMVEGISMSVTQRDEFVSVIRQTGGKVAGLIKALRKKTASN
ncbi:MAG: MlaC/ttg2D family ABC transporter substrate-binding protein [Alphaproteobacteria bacterium]